MSEGAAAVVNVVLLLVMLGVGLTVVMCLDFEWLRIPSRGERRHTRVGLRKP